MSVKKLYAGLNVSHISENPIVILVLGPFCCTGVGTDGVATAVGTGATAVGTGTGAATAVGTGATTGAATGEGIACKRLTIAFFHPF